MTGVTHAFAERRHGGRIGNVFLLGDGGHRQMFFDQPDNEFGVLFLQAVCLTEGFGIDHAEFGVIAATAFGDVMKEGCQD